MSYTDDQGRPELTPAAWFGRQPAILRRDAQPGATAQADADLSDGSAGATASPAAAAGGGRAAGVATTGPATGRPAT